MGGSITGMGLGAGSIAGLVAGVGLAATGVGAPLAIGIGAAIAIGQERMTSTTIHQQEDQQATTLKNARNSADKAYKREVGAAKMQVSSLNAGLGRQKIALILAKRGNRAVTAAAATGSSSVSLHDVREQRLMGKPVGLV